MPGNVATEGLAATSDEHQALMLTSIPMGRYAEPADVGWAARFLASPRGRLHHRADAGRGRRPGAARGDRLGAAVRLQRSRGTSQYAV